MSEQRWLSLDGLCTTLGITRKHVLWLAKKGTIPMISGRPGAKYKTARFLDPTNEYKQKLVLAEAIYGRLFPVPKDLELTGLLTTREVAAIMGWSLKYARNTLSGKAIPSVSVTNRRVDGKSFSNLYSVAVIRNLLWQRQDRKKGQRRNPFLIDELIYYFQTYYAAECEEVPTDTMFREDDLLMRKLNRLARTKDPEALRDFMDKVKLARKVARKLPA